MSDVQEGSLATYNDPGVVAYYEKQADLQPAERHLFDRHLRPGMSILDIGVGGGRTTRHLSKFAGRYLGADYSQAMVDACRRAWPELEFRCADATDLAGFPDGEFDAVVFSFNGIDYIASDDGRRRCLQELSRVLKPGGIFIFSSHNARELVVPPALSGARFHQVVWRAIRSFFKSASVAWRNLSGGVFARGEGYLIDPVHGGLLTYMSTPKTMEPQLHAAGFRVLEVVGGPSPDIKFQPFICWHYYACRKAEAA